MRNPNKVTRTTRTTSTEFIQIYTYASAGIAQCDLGSMKRTYNRPTDKVELVKNTIIVSQQLWE